MKRVLSLLAGMALLLSAGPVGAEPTAGGFVSDNVEFVRNIPIEAGTATGARLVGKHLYLTSWKSISIYDVSDPVDPVLLSMTPVGLAFENEDVSTDGQVLLFSESAPGNALHVWDVSNKERPVKVAELPGAGDHTHTCILRCRWSYGADGSIVDLRDPPKARVVGDWHEKLGITGGTHDVDEFRNGFIVTSPYFSGPIQLVDVRRPMHPDVIVSGKPHPVAPEPVPAASNVHATKWPRGGRDRFLMAEGGSNLYQQTCSPEGRNFWLFDASRWRGGGPLRFLDEYFPGSGTFTDGKLPVSPLGCSPHWFDVHPEFRNGGLVAVSYYDYGTRILRITRRGAIEEAGWFLPYGGVTFSAYWLTEEIVYAVDAVRGIDILRFRDA
ncbi:MAG TPA: hypothetical protein VHL78_13560 [Actinomycetota bacterium]|nr:hypothetical protein [Actinomycetota bacterium]